MEGSTGSSGTTPPTTGAVGQTGAQGGPPTISSGSTTSTPPAHPKQVPNPGYQQVGNFRGGGPPIQETKGGAGLQQGWAAVHQAMTATLPGVRQSLQNLAKRPFGG